MLFSKNIAHPAAWMLKIWNLIRVARNFEFAAVFVNCSTFNVFMNAHLLFSCDSISNNLENSIFWSGPAKEVFKHCFQRHNKPKMDFFCQSGSFKIQVPQLNVDQASAKRSWLSVFILHFIFSIDVEQCSMNIGSRYCHRCHQLRMKVRKAPFWKVACLFGQRPKGASLREPVKNVLADFVR